MKRNTDEEFQVALSIKKIPIPIEEENDIKDNAVKDGNCIEEVKPIEEEYVQQFSGAGKNPRIAKAIATELAIQGFRREEDMQEILIWF